MKQHLDTVLLQTPVPPWIQGLMCRVLGGAWLFTLSLPLQSPFTWPSLQHPLFKLLQLFACKAHDSTRFCMTCAMHGTWFSGLGLIKSVVLWTSWNISPPCHLTVASWCTQLPIRTLGWCEVLSQNRAHLVCREPSSSEPTVLSRARFASGTGQIHDTASLQNTFSYTRYNRAVWALSTQAGWWHCWMDRLWMNYLWTKNFKRERKALSLF